MSIESYLSTSGSIVLVVAEKPSVAKRLAQVLSKSWKAGASEYNKGKSKYNPFYTITANKNIVYITSVTGFLYGLNFVSPFSRKSKWKVDGLDGMIDAEMIWEVTGEKSYRINNLKIIAQIKELAKKADLFISATDNDFAGELIGYQALEVAMQSNLKIKSARMVFSSIGYTDIVNAWNGMQPMREHHKNAELARQKTDLLTGALFTRLLTLLVQQKVPGVMISWGGCQTLFLKHVKDRYDAHHNFQSQPFWELVAIVKYKGKEYEVKWDHGKEFDSKQAKKALLSLKGKSEALVTEVIKSDWKKYPPVPLRTATMLNSLSRITGYSPGIIMGVAEALYNKGFISYPRTENESHPFSFNANNVLSKFTEHPQYGGYVTQLLSGGDRIHPRRGKHQTKDHDPIYSIKDGTQSQVESAMNSTTNKKHKSRAWRVYDFIARHFIATCSKEALFHKTDLKLQIGDKTFLASGKVKVKDGFMKIYPFYKPSITKVPACKKDEVLLVVKLELREGITQPPALSDEAELVKWAADNSIGTDATFHMHIETIQKRKYVEKDSNKKLVPTELGISLANTLDQYAPLMIDVELRHALQEKMDNISTGKISPDQVIEEFKQFSRQSYDQLQKSATAVADSISNTLMQERGSGQEIGICATCGGTLSLQTKIHYGDKYSRYAVCGECETALILPKQGIIEPILDKRCKICNFTPIKVKKGKGYVICPFCFKNEIEKGVYFCSMCKEDCKFAGGQDVEGSADVQTKSAGPCPKCGEDVIVTFAPGKCYAKCSKCKFFSRLPSPTKGLTDISSEKCADCNMKKFLYRKRQGKEYGKSSYFCIGCEQGKFKWHF